MSDIIKTYWAMPSTKKGVVLALSLLGLNVPVEVIQMAGELVIGAITFWEIARKEKVPTK